MGFLCCFPGCRSRCAPWSTHTFHRIPHHNKGMRQLWLVALNMDINLAPAALQNLRVCSLHFSEDDFVRPLSQKSQRRLLKSTAVPIHQVCSQEKAEEPQEDQPLFLDVPQSTPKKVQDEGHQALTLASQLKLVLTSPAQTLPREGPSTSGAYFAFPPVRPQSEVCSQEKAEEPQEDQPLFLDVPQSTPKKVQDEGHRALTLASQLKLVLSSPAQTLPREGPSTSGAYFAFPPVRPQSEPTTEALQQLETSMSSFALDTASSSEGAPADGEGDSLYAPPSVSSPSTPSAETEPEDADVAEPGYSCHRRWIVNEANLMQLFTNCHQCGVSIDEKTIVTRGSKIRIEWSCLAGHNGVWQSCPDVRGLPENNLLSSAAILFTGTTETEISEWAEVLNLQLPSKTSYYTLQSAYPIPVVHEAYKEMQDEMLNYMRELSTAGAKFDVCGDARSDSPGFSAKYTTYSYMDDVTKKIVMSDLVQVSETTSSPMMEPVGFRRGLDRLLASGVSVDVVTTDRAPSIRKIMRESYPDLRHQFDPWHVAKGLKKKIRAAARKKENMELDPWTKAIGNHFWWCCSTCGHDEMELRRRWTSILYHICGIHRWEEEGEEYRCYHGDLTEEEQRKKKWIVKGSAAYNALKTIVMDKTLLRDMAHMTLFKHTGELEVYHSSMLKYAEKRRHFKYTTMQARTQLSIMDHNHNVGRAHASTIEGSKRYSIFHSKLSNQWMVKKIYEPTIQDFRKDLLNRVIQRRQDTKLRSSDPQLRVHPPTHIPAHIGPTNKPEKESLVAQHKSRF